MPSYQLPYGKSFLPLELDEGRLAFYAPPVAVEEITDPDVLIAGAFAQPYGSPRLEDAVKPGQKIAILLDDVTRPTPKRRLLLETLTRLAKAGVPDSDITVIVALGTHRTLTAAEIAGHYGEDIPKRFRFLNIDYKDESQFVDLGKSANGTPIQVYRAVTEADFKIAIGNIVPHIAAGWGGGGKMIQPGVCSEKTTEVTHLLACTIQNVLEACGTTDNLCRKEMETIAEKVGLDFIVNTVMDEKKNLLGVFAGHFIAAHRAGVELANKVMRPSVKERADIVIASANPANIDFWQGCKPYIFSHFGVRDGGVIIFLISGEEGLCGNAPQHEATLRKYAAKPFAEIKADVDGGVITDIVGINVPLFVATVRDRVTTLCVSDGFSERDIRDLGFIPCANLASALSEAEKLVGKNTSVGIIPYCGETLVRCEENA